MAPVSLQTKKKGKKAAFIEYVKSIVEQAGFLLSGDVVVELEWFVHEQKRYESADSADVDNIIKPLLDGLCGARGIMVDDSQVQSVRCAWVDSYDYDQEQVKVIVKYSPDEFLSKNNLVFINMGEGLCMPLNRHIPEHLQASFLSIFSSMLENRAYLVSMGASYYEAKKALSVQRIFHKCRLEDFSVMELVEIELELGLENG